MVLEGRLRRINSRWQSRSELIFASYQHAAKTKVMLITTNQKRRGLNKEGLNLKYKDDTLQTTSNEKILGVFVDNNLLWSEHVKHITKKIASNIWLLSKIKIFLSQEYRVQFYKSYIQPHIDFCNIVWGSTSESNKLKILRLQKRVIRVILDYNVENTQEAMKSLNIQSIYDRLFLRKAKFMFKVFNGLTPTYVSENFSTRSNLNTSVNLRSTAARCFVPPKPRTECFKQSMRYAGCLIWNSLPDEVKMLRLKKHSIKDVWNGFWTKFQRYRKMIIQQAKLMLFFFFFFFLHMYVTMSFIHGILYFIVFHTFSSQFFVCVHLCGCELICITLYLHMYNAWV